MRHLVHLLNDGLTRLYAIYVMFPKADFHRANDVTLTVSDLQMGNG